MCGGATYGGEHVVYVSEEMVMTERMEYKMTQEQYDALVEACTGGPLIMLQCGMPPSPRENANAAWVRLGLSMGFKGMTVKPSDKGKLFFTAEPL